MFKLETHKYTHNTVLSFWFEVALMHIPYTAEFINRNRVELTFKQVTYGISYSFMIDKWYYLIYLTLHWPFLINLRLFSLSINSYEYSCHTISAGFFNALFIWLIYGKVAQWLKFRVVNNDIMGSNPAETVYFFILFFLFSRILIKSSFCRLFAYFPCFYVI